MRFLHGPVRHWVWPLAAGIALTACELTEVTLADAQDVVIVEIVLRAGDTRQQAFLYRTIGTGLVQTVDGAEIQVLDEAGQVMAFIQAPVAECLEGGGERTEPGSCYRSRSGPVEIVPNRTYSLAITLADGRRITGRTTVPGGFEVRRPAVPACQLEADRTLELQWTRADNAWVYVSEVRLTGLAAALEARGVTLLEDPVRLIGLSISREDTTLVFPTGFGLFDRANTAVADALLAIRDGLPPDVVAGVVIAAADRNYVNWVRGGNFNPSGQVRVPSVEGAGTGVFGSIVPEPRTLSTVATESTPACE